MYPDKPPVMHVQVQAGNQLSRRGLSDAALQAAAPGPSQPGCSQDVQISGASTFAAAVVQGASGFAEKITDNTQVGTCYISKLERSS
jgi:hypothetical protein